MQFTLSDKEGKFTFTPPAQETYWLYAAKPFMNNLFEDKKGGDYIMYGMLDFGDRTDIANAFNQEVKNNPRTFSSFKREGNMFTFIWSDE